MHIVYYHCTKDQIKIQTPKMLISRFKFKDYSYFNSCSIFETPITQLAKSPVLRASGNDNSKSRYENDLKIFMALLDR